MVTELWGCCRDPLAFGYFRVPLPKIRVYLQDGWRLLSETYSLALTKKLWLLDVNLVYQVPGNNLNLLVIIISIFNFQIFSNFFKVISCPFVPISRSSSLPPFRQERFWIRGRRGGDDWILSSLQWIVWRHLREPWAGALLLRNSSFQWTTSSTTFENDIHILIPSYSFSLFLTVIFSEKGLKLCSFIDIYNRENIFWGMIQMLSNNCGWVV